MLLKNFINWAELKVEDLKANGIKASLTIGKPSSNSSARVDIDTIKHAGRITFWENGSCDQELLDVSSELQVFHRHGQLDNSDFENHFKDFFTSAKT